MTYLPSPPSSPLLVSATEKVLCGSCDRALGTDWFCSACHTKCSTCNRFLTGQEYCTRCWLYDHGHRTLIRKRNISSSSTSSVAATAASVAASFRMLIPSPTTSSSSLPNREEDYLPYHSYF